MEKLTFEEAFEKYGREGMLQRAAEWHREQDAAKQQRSNDPRYDKLLHVVSVLLDDRPPGTMQFEAMANGAYAVMTGSDPDGILDWMEWRDEQRRAKS